MKQKETYRYRKQTCGCPGEAGWGKDEWKVGVSKCKLLYIERLNNKVLLYSTGNYIQYLMKNHNGKECFKKNVHIHVTESICCTAEIHTSIKKKKECHGG